MRNLITRYKDLNTGRVYNVGARMGSYRIESIQLQKDSSIRSLALSYCKADGTPDKRRKMKYIWAWEL